MFRAEKDPRAPACARRSHRISDLELASRLSFFLWSSIPDDELLTAAAQGRLKEPHGARAAGAAHAGRPAGLGARQQLRRANGCTCGTCGTWCPARTQFPDFDDNLRQALQRETELLLEHVMKQDRSVRRAADRRLHVRQRAAGAALRHPQRLRHAVPPRAGDERGPPRPARARQHPDGDVAAQPHLAGAARQVDSRQPARHAAAAAAADVPPLKENSEREPSADDARADGGAPRQSGVRELPQAHGPAGLRAGELRRRRRLAHQRPARADRSVQRAGRRHAASTVRRRCGRRWCAKPGRVRRHDDREDADLRARPRARTRTTCRPCGRSCATPAAATTASRPSCSASSRACRSRCERAQFQSPRPLRRLVDPRVQESRDVHQQTLVAAPDVPARAWASRWRCRCSTRWCRR